MRKCRRRPCIPQDFKDIKPIQVLATWAEHVFPIVEIPGLHENGKALTVPPINLQPTEALERPKKPNRER